MKPLNEVKREAIEEFVEKVKAKIVKEGWDWKASGGSNIFDYLSQLNKEAKNEK